MQKLEGAPKYPDIKVQLSGEDGNAGAIMGRVSRALAANGVPPEEVRQFCEEAMSGTYDDLLQTCMRWVGVS